MYYQSNITKTFKHLVFFIFINSITCCAFSALSLVSARVRVSFDWILLLLRRVFLLLTALSGDLVSAAGDLFSGPPSMDLFTTVDVFDGGSDTIPSPEEGLTDFIVSFQSLLGVSCGWLSSIEKLGLFEGWGVIARLSSSAVVWSEGAGVGISNLDLLIRGLTRCFGDTTGCACVITLLSND